MDGWAEFDLRRSTGGPISTMIAIEDGSSVGEARRAAVAVATDAGLDENTRSDIAIITTELATNLARHTQGGRFLVRPLNDPSGTPAPGALSAPPSSGTGVEMLALDKGPGIGDLSRALVDGFSTSGTAGQGLGAVRRLAHEFDLTSALGVGTAIVARVWSARPPTESRVGVVCVPLAGERVCGDGWAVVERPTHTLIAMVDGLGHGPEAATAADAALGVFHEHADEAPARLLPLAHAALRPTRGGAVAVAWLPHGEPVLRFAGVGNISGSIITSDGVKSLASRNGTVGHTPHTVHEYSYPCPPGAIVVLHSDGVMTRWKLESYPGLLLRDPALIAGILHRDFARGRDDATVVVMRAGRQTS